MQKQIIMILSFLLCGCSSITAPDGFVYKEVHTKNFNIATWQKITDPDSVYKIYIEGDGHAFNSKGRATQDPTPKGTLVRELAFGDNNSNVIYLSRPCQYIKSPICSKRYWTTARFAPEIIDAEYDAIKQIVGNNPVILVGFSGGAQVVGLIASTKSDLNIKKIITIAGNLDHSIWTEHHRLPPLNESMNLVDYQEQFFKIPQIHYAGQNDNIIPIALTEQFIKNKSLIIIVPNATHNSGWKIVYEEIQAEN